MSKFDSITSQDASSNITTAPVPLSSSINYSAQAVFTGSDVAGVFALEASNFEDPDTFVAISGATDNVSASATSLLNVENAGYDFIRATWTYSSGTGNISIRISRKDELREIALR